MSEFTLEAHYKIYNDADGSYIEVKPDADALGLIEIRQFDEGKEVARLTLPAKQAELLRQAINLTIIANPDTISK